MFKRYCKSVLFIAGILAAFSSFAQNPEKERIVVAPQCLLKKANAHYTTLSSINAFSLIKIDEAEIEKLIALKHARSSIPCGGFMDVTLAWDHYAKQKMLPDKEKSFLLSYTKTPEPLLTSRAAKYTINYPAQVKEVLSYFNSQNMWNDLTFLSNFPDRSAKTDYGIQAADWIKSQIETIAKNTGHDDVSVYYIDTDHFNQRSVVARIGKVSGSSSNKAKIPGIVIGGHMDTLSSYFENEPGADDDGTGSVTVLEVARSLLASGMHFKKPIYLIWYAAEEPGLVGSSSVVAEFKAKKIPVDAVMQLDMTGYAPDNDLTMWLITDYVNADLTTFLGDLIKTYVNRKVQYTYCGYACSDHASWHQKGYPASIAFEAEMGNENPDIHTSLDTMDHLSLDHMADFAKLAIAFAVELAEPVV